MPENWVWCKIDDLRQTNDTDSFADGPFGSNLKREHQTDKKEVRIIQLSNISDNGWKDDNVKYTTFEHLKTIARCEVKPNDFIIAKMMPAGRTIIMPDLGTKIVLGSDVIRFVPSSKVNKKYLLYVMQSELYLMQIADDIHGIGRMRTSLSKLKECFIPLPPLNEQQRIVSEIERWANEIKSIKEAEKDLSRVIEQTKSEILNLAIRGKLIPQDPCDEPAIELLRQINPAFQPTDTSHYENLPDSWCEISMGEICKLTDGIKMSGKRMPYIDVKYLRGTKECEIVDNGKHITANTKLILVDGENSGEVFNSPIEGYQGSTFKILDISKHLNVNYVLLLIRRSQKLLRENKVGSAIPHLNKKMFRELVVPIPPFKEQLRIVNEVDRYSTLLDSITAEL